MTGRVTIGSPLAIECGEEANLARLGVKDTPPSG